MSDYALTTDVPLTTHNGGKKSKYGEEIKVTPPAFRTVRMHIAGTSPLVMNKLSQKTQDDLEASQSEGGRSKNKNNRQPKDFNELYESAKHVSRDGWCGIPCTAFRGSAIAACRLGGFTMVLAKLVLFVEADGYDKDDGSPLVRITKGIPEPLRNYVKNANNVIDIRCRPIWHEWECDLRVTFDNDKFSLEDIVNLIARVGKQVGILAGRPGSVKSTGMGWGLFDVHELYHDGETK
jgi:hypothetical protein